MKSQHKARGTKSLYSKQLKHLRDWTRKCKLVQSLTRTLRLGIPYQNNPEIIYVPIRLCISKQHFNFYYPDVLSHSLLTFPLEKNSPYATVSNKTRYKGNQERHINITCMTQPTWNSGIKKKIYEMKS